MSIKGKIEQKRQTRPGQDGDGDDLAVQIANLQRELAESRSKLGEIEKDREGWRAKAEKAEGSLVTERINRALYSAAIAAGAIEPDDVVELVRSKGARIEGDKVVFGQGAEAKDASAFVASYLEAKPHLRKSAPVAQGSGAPATQAGSAPAAPPKKEMPDPSDTAAVNAWYAQQQAERTRKVNEKAQTKREA